MTTGREKGKVPRLRFWPGRRPHRWRTLRAWLGLILLLVTAAILEWWSRGPPPARETIRSRVTLCGPGRGEVCVIDGDTIRVGSRRIRIEGIDAPEMAGRCAAEIALAIRSRDRLRGLLDAGPFEIVASSGRAFDQHGRELRRIERAGRDLGDQLVAEKLARRYKGHKEPWCRTSGGILEGAQALGG